MLELTKEQCLELEKRVADKMHLAVQGSESKSELFEMIAKIASRATIMTIREYERMQVECSNAPQSAE